MSTHFKFKGAFSEQMFKLADLTIMEKRMLIDFLGARLEPISLFLHERSDEIDVEEFFLMYYVPLRDLCDSLEATYGEDLDGGSL